MDPVAGILTAIAFLCGYFVGRRRALISMSLDPGNYVVGEKGMMPTKVLQTVPYEPLPADCEATDVTGFQCMRYAGHVEPHDFTR